MVSDFAWRGGSSGPTGAAVSAGASSVPATLTSQVGELVLADLQLVAVLELVRVDPPAVDVRPVQRARVVEEPLPRALDEHGVVARDRHVVEEDLGVRRAPDAHALAVQRERLADATAARADHERAAGRRRSEERRVGKECRSGWA